MCERAQTVVYIWKCKHVWHLISHCVLHVWTGQCGQCTDLIHSILSGAHLWKRLWRLEPGGYCQPVSIGHNSMVLRLHVATSRLDVCQKRQLRVLHAQILLTPDCQIWLFWFFFFLFLGLFSWSEVCAGCFILRTDLLHCAIPVPKFLPGFALLDATSVKNRPDAYFKLSRADETETCCSVSGWTYRVGELPHAAPAPASPIHLRWNQAVKLTNQQFLGSDQFLPSCCWLVHLQIEK